MQFKNRIKGWHNGIISGSMFVLAFIVTLSMTLTKAEAIDSEIEQLPVEEQTALRNGKTVITGEAGKYVAKVLITASPEQVWAVLIDYENASKFLPHVISSQVLESNGNRKVVERINERRIFIVTVRSRIRTENLETDKKRIDFRLLEGDLQKLQGYWQIERVSPTQVLLVQEIEVKPKADSPEDIFYDIFQDSLEETLDAIRQEVEQRNASDRVVPRP